METERKTRVGTCAYCRSEVSAENLTEDHVIARSWYPKNTPPIEKWKVPSCNDCNNRYSAQEQDVLIRLAMCADPGNPGLKPIVESALRSIDPTFAKSARDAKHRFNRREALRKDLKEIHDPRGIGVLPWSLTNFIRGSRIGIRVPAKSLTEVVEKWIRGVHFCELERFVPGDYQVSVFIVDDEVAYKAFSNIVKHAKRIQKGPGVEVLIWHIDDDEESISLYAFNIWNAVRIYGSVDKIEGNKGVNID